MFQHIAHRTGPETLRRCATTNEIACAETWKETIMNPEPVHPFLELLAFLFRTMRFIFDGVAGPVVAD
jgi:hypothetical protein